MAVHGVVTVPLAVDIATVFFAVLWATSVFHACLSQIGSLVVLLAVWDGWAEVNRRAGTSAALLMGSVAPA
jgi:hypothetical protein